MVKVNVGRNYFIGTFLLLCGIILTSLEQNASGQSNLTVTSQEKDKSGNEKSESLHSVYSGLGFGNNMIYLGSNVSQDKPFLYTSVAYGYKNEFFASVSVNTLLLMILCCHSLLSHLIIIVILIPGLIYRLVCRGIRLTKNYLNRFSAVFSMDTLILALTGKFFTHS